MIFDQSKDSEFSNKPYKNLMFHRSEPNLGVNKILDPEADISHLHPPIWEEKGNITDKTLIAISFGQNVIMFVLLESTGTLECCLSF